MDHNPRDYPRRVGLGGSDCPRLTIRQLTISGFVGNGADSVGYRHGLLTQSPRARARARKKIEPGPGGNILLYGDMAL